MNETFHIREYLESLTEPDPYTVLQVPPDADDETIEQAYRNALKNESISASLVQEAYIKINSLQKRIKLALLTPAPAADARHILQDMPPRLRHHGPGKWYRLFLSAGLEQKKNN